MKSSEVPLFQPNFMPLCAMMTAHMQVYIQCREHIINIPCTSITQNKQKENTLYYSNLLDRKSIIFCCQHIHKEEKNVTIAIDFPLPLITSD